MMSQTAGLFRLFLCLAVVGLPTGCGSSDTASGDPVVMRETDQADDAEADGDLSEVTPPATPEPDRSAVGGAPGLPDGMSNAGKPADAGSPRTQDGVAGGDASNTDANPPTDPARSHDPCRHPEECTNGGDVNDVWNVMTCFAPWQPRPIGTDPGPGCENQGCPDGQRCRADGYCEAISCDSAADCATDFECSSGTCRRMSCASDDDCDAFCVNGGCSQTLGVCDYQTAA